MRNLFKLANPSVISLGLVLCAAQMITQAQAQTPMPSQPIAPTAPPQTPSTQMPTPPTTPPPPPPQPAAPAANPADVASLDAILASIYDVISGPKGKARDWDRFRSLFTPGARLIPTGKRPTGETVSRALTVEQFIASSGKYMEENGFFERAIANHAQTFANIAQVFSVYETLHDAKDAKPFARGINSIQLMNDGKRWWVVTIFWQAEDDAYPIPAQYLKVSQK